jgi:hypothetical protein
MARETGHPLGDPRDADDFKVTASILRRDALVADACVRLGGVVLDGRPRMGFGRQDPELANAAARARHGRGSD